MNILGVKIDNLTKDEILARIENFLVEDKFHQIATVNPEIILWAQKDQKLKSILNQCDLNVADGVGIWYAFIRKFSYLKNRIAGADLMEHILQMANDKKLSVYFALSDKGLSSFMEIQKAIIKKYPQIKIAGKKSDPKEPYIIHDTKYQILLCNFGAPYQEKFLNAQKNGTINLAIGVGGSFDFLTKKIKRAPKFLRYLGLEWLYRFLQEPTYRYRRIINAAVIFPIKVIFQSNE